ncbi:ABC-2 type transport system ATP-binding protein [Antricoccus suffuscus]|uniref:ABC-2 type transport system ATP-binding protein n=1 Tax=Antricoccus suffuscus TaxID=1629062 RepID=A0A2T1A6E7_9ACTN|nr:ABC transporter ATP-binding protein [Antricoccus suffuscus]PRZ44166.1 ABC-2 type transport system ATP-binding protein [Antricoccus suffuscus]
MSVIAISNLRKTYGDKVAVEDVSFTVEEGEIFGILGPNGAGKTTTVECMIGLTKPDGGTLEVLGLNPVRQQQALTKYVGVQLQEASLPDKMTVAEAMELYSSFYDDPADIDELLQDLGIQDSAKTRFAKLSGGQKQRLSIALALIGQPRIAVLDELTTGLDPVARRETWSLIERMRDRGVTIVLVTHFMEEAEHLCDRIAIIDAGRVVALDTPAGLAMQVAAEQTMRFIPSAPVDEAALKALPEVTSVSHDGDHLVIAGNDTVIQAVMGVLARNNIVAGQLRVDQADLDDAFVAITGKNR